MKRTIVAAGLLFFFARAEAQNLVNNPSFESYSTCPNGFGQLTYATGWSVPNVSSPDYFNSCNNDIADVPTNLVGYQTAKTGQAYAGLWAYTSSQSNVREYIQVALSDTLQQGKKYCVSFYCSLANDAEFSIANLGVLFSATQISQGDNGVINGIPQVENPISNLLTDTSNWMEVSGSFIATGGERYLIIGNFHDDANTNVQSTTITGYDIAYYYIDDVSVTEVTSSCSAGNDGIVCMNDSLQLGIAPYSNVTYSWQPSSGLNNPNISNPKASPSITTTYTLTQTECSAVSTSTVTVIINSDCSAGATIFIPTILYGDDQLKIQGLESNSMLEIFDSRGRKVFVAEDYQNDFRANELLQAIYFVRLARPNGEVMHQKLCIIK